jgi:hypothetical protein
MDIHESPVTALQYYADCPPDLIPAFYSVGSKQKRSGFSEKVLCNYLAVKSEKKKCLFHFTIVRSRIIPLHLMKYSFLRFLFDSLNSP